MDYPLEGIRVIDMSRVLAGPFAGRMLADLGAEVVKVEPPDQDVTRRWGKEIGGVSGYYNQQNAGKKNISIDLNAAEGQALLKSLVSKADILLENFRPGVMDRLGVGYEALKAVNPGLIMLSISGFGQHGPEARRAAYAPIIHAETGAILRQAQRAGCHPVEMAMSFADTNAGLHGLVGVLAALHLRNRTGVGQHLDIAMVDAMVATDDHTHAHLDSVESQTGASEVWDATGGPIILAGDFRHIWRQFNTVLGLADPTPDGASLEEKIRCRRDAAAAFLVSFETRAALTEALDKARLAWGNVNETADFLRQSPTVTARGSVVSVDDRVGGTRPVFQSPYRFSNASSGVRGGAPHQGEHNTSVLGEWLSLPTEEIERLEQAGVLARGKQALE